MKIPLSINFGKYSGFIEKLDLEISSLEKKNAQHITCFPGCSSCCKVPRSVLPIEAFWIIQKTAIDKDSLGRVFSNVEESENCPFLVEDLCTIYEDRPVICRTHGLPLLNFFSETNDYHISHCDLNFKSHSGNFTKEIILNMETINETLRLINAESDCGESRIPFNDLNFLKKIKVKNQ